MDACDGASDEGVTQPALSSLSVTPPLGRYLRDVAQRWEFTWSLALGAMRAQHLDTMLGNLWHVLNPFLLVGVYYLVFGVLIKTDRGVDNFIAFLTVGIFAFTYGQRTVIACGSSIANNLGLIRSLQFPRAVLPLSTVLREFFGYGFAYVVMLALLVATGERPSFSWLLSIPIVMLLTVFCAGLGLVLARVTDRIRDMSELLPYVFRVLFYVSGIIFSLQAFVDSAQIRRVFILNPFFTYIDLLRHVLMPSYDVEHLRDEWILAVVIAPVSLLVGLYVFRGGERDYGRG
jgi:teichoic acid transport system permease protein